jgi:hypothetical protein
VEGLTFQDGSALLTFRRADGGGAPAAERPVAVAGLAGTLTMLTVLRCRRSRVRGRRPAERHGVPGVAA